MISLDLLDFLKSNSVRYSAPVNTADIVSFKVGGVGRAAIFPKDQRELLLILDLVGKEKFVVLGKGTNCYFTEANYDGIVVVTTDLNEIYMQDDFVVAECGATINSLCKFALENGLSGLEFAYGIPGTVGGGVCMNASAFGGCFADVVDSSIVYDCFDSKMLELDYASHRFGVKNSVFRFEPFCLLKVRFRLSRGNKAEIKSKMDEYIKKRALTQPLELPSAGSTFVRPKNAYASYLIDKAGLKGYKIGGAMVSEKHAGFIVNCGNATSKDVIALIQHIKSVVFEKFSVSLKEEIIYLE